MLSLFGKERRTDAVCFFLPKKYENIQPLNPSVSLLVWTLACFVHLNVLSDGNLYIEILEPLNRKFIHFSISHCTLLVITSRQLLPGALLIIIVSNK